MSWFEDYFGFKESASYSKIQAEFSLDDRLYLHCSKSRFPKQYVGEFTTPSLTELKQIRDTTADSDYDAKEGIGGLRFTHEAHPLGVEPLLFNSENEGAVFQKRTAARISTHVVLAVDGTLKFGAFRGCLPIQEYQESNDRFTKFQAAHKQVPEQYAGQRFSKRSPWLIELVEAHPGLLWPALLTCPPSRPSGRDRCGWIYQDRH